MGYTGNWTGVPLGTRKPPMIMSLPAFLSSEVSTHICAIYMLPQYVSGSPAVIHGDSLLVAAQMGVKILNGH